ncbi:MAG: hypothetical protein GVY17_12130 [Cyanobacteria bacterium]|jgi:phage shock protein A|nr:hypothetical protein [Cyanobacteria bacterium GSL.Bin21]
MIEEPNYSSHQTSNDDDATSRSQQAKASAQELNVEELVDRALERKQTLQDTNRLRSQVGWLTGFFVIAVILFGGGLGWVAYRLQVQQRQIADQNATSPETLERIQQLESQIETLSQQVPDLQRIESLEEQLDQLTTTVNENQQAMQQALEETDTLDVQRGLEESIPSESEDSALPGNENETGTSN